jgi:hypothetical protein
MNARVLLGSLVIGGLLCWAPLAEARSADDCLDVLMNHHAEMVKIVERHTAKPKCAKTPIKLEAYHNSKSSKIKNAQKCLKRTLKNMPPAKRKKFGDRLISDSIKAERDEHKALKAFKKTCKLHHKRVADLMGKSLQLQ